MNPFTTRLAPRLISAVASVVLSLSLLSGVARLADPADPVVAAQLAQVQAPAAAGQAV